MGCEVKGSKPQARVQTEDTVNTYFLTGDRFDQFSTHPTEEAALKAARTAGYESFEIRDDTDAQVYVEFPTPTWM